MDGAAVFCVIRSLCIEWVKIMLSLMLSELPSRNMRECPALPARGEFCLVYSAKPSLEVTVVNLLLKGEKVKYG